MAFLDTALEKCLFSGPNFRLRSGANKVFPACASGPQARAQTGSTPGAAGADGIGNAADCRVAWRTFCLAFAWRPVEVLGDYARHTSNLCGGVDGSRFCSFHRLAWHYVRRRGAVANRHARVSALSVRTGGRANHLALTARCFCCRANAVEHENVWKVRVVVHRNVETMLG